MAPSEKFAALLRGTEPLLALAPMQDVTDLAFWRVSAPLGQADAYWTEYFRAHRDSTPERWIVDAILQNPTGRPVVAQIIGDDVSALVRTARQLQHFPIAAVDLNLGCPAPVVCRKGAGGALLRRPDRIDAILGALREAVAVPFSVKTRVGFEDGADFERLLPLFARHGIDLLTVHGRTVDQMYRPGVRYDLIAQAARCLRCPVLANGNIHSAPQALAVLAQTGARGLMIGRAAIRNPWLFSQIRQCLRGQSPTLPTGRQVLAYIRQLWDAQVTPGAGESAQVQRLKKFMNFIGEGVPPAGTFLHQIRRVATRNDFFRLCEAHLDHDRPLSLEPSEAQEIRAETTGWKG